MRAIKGEKRVRIIRNKYQRAALWLARLGAIAIVVSLADGVLYLVIDVSDARCWNFRSGCGGAFQAPLDFGLRASLIAAAAGLVGGAVLFVVSLAAPKDAPSGTEGTGSLPRRSPGNEEPASLYAEHGQTGQSTLSPEAAAAELQRIRAAGLNTREQEEEIQALRNKVNGSDTDRRC